MRTGFPVSDEGIKQLRIEILRELSASPYPREALPKIAMRNRLTVGDVKALVERHGWPDAGAMGRAAEVLDGKASTPASNLSLEGRRIDAAIAPRATSSKPRNDNAKIRAWAAENGVVCAPSGRVPVAVVEAYELANPSEGDS